ncbi:unnamed protein product [Amoebophrya sp. A120]|nr:unnamed protein product [Amoebophrya sp. A120]|eukprot:GSA120T00022412001.1
MLASDDAYNQALTDPTFQHHRFIKFGTLMANWYEELVLREQTGQGRYIPQRHVRRSGLLKDFTKKPSEVKETDDTFQRVYGHRVYDKLERSSGETGKFFREGNLDAHAEDNFSSAGPRELQHADKAVEFAEQYMKEVEQVEKDKCIFPFPTTTTQDMVPRMEATRRVAEPLRTRSDVKTTVKYATDVPITFYSEQLKSAKSYIRSSLNASAATGHHAFGKNSSFSCHTSFMRCKTDIVLLLVIWIVSQNRNGICHAEQSGTSKAHLLVSISHTTSTVPFAHRWISLAKVKTSHKVHEDNLMFEKAEKNLPNIGQPTDDEAVVAGKVPVAASLVELKKGLVDGLKAGKEGPFCLAKLRCVLKSIADSDNFVPCAAVVELIGGIGGEVVKLSHLLGGMRINADVNFFSLLESIRPAVRKGGEREVWIDATVGEDWTKIAAVAGDEYAISNAEEARTFALDVASCCADLPELKSALGM